MNCSRASPLNSVAALSPMTYVCSSTAKCSSTVILPRSLKLNCFHSKKGLFVTPPVKQRSALECFYHSTQVSSVSASTFAFNHYVYASFFEPCWISVCRFRTYWAVREVPHQLNRLLRASDANHAISPFCLSSTSAAEAQRQLPRANDNIVLSTALSAMISSWRCSKLLSPSVDLMVKSFLLCRVCQNSLKLP